MVTLAKFIQVNLEGAELPAWALRAGKAALPLFCVAWVSGCAEVAPTGETDAASAAGLPDLGEASTSASSSALLLPEDAILVDPSAYASARTPTNEESTEVASTPKPKQSSKPQTTSIQSSDLWSGEWVAKIDKSEQRMRVYRDGALAYSWKVSTGKASDPTPSGSWMVLKNRIYPYYHSEKYDSPMPHSVFFHGGLAVHGTAYTHKLGTPASRGCIRLAPANARRFFNLAKVQKNKLRITVHQ